MTEPRRKIAKTLQLSEPIHSDGRTITVLEFEEPRARHLRMMPAEPQMLGEMIPVIASLCDVADEAIEELTSKDFVAATEIVAGFFEVPAPSVSSRSRKRGVTR